MSTHDQPEDGPLLIRREGRVLILTLNRPERLNALTPELHHALHAAVLDAAHDATVGALVLTGAGRAFCSGGDMSRDKSPAGPPPSLEERADELRRHAETARLLHVMPKPTIAMLNGVAAGAGLALAVACDLRLASTTAMLTTSYVKVAMSGDLGVTYFLTQLLGPSRALELLLLGGKIDAAHAHRIGLVNRLEEPDALAQATLELARQLADGPAVALRYIKRNVLCAETGTLDEVIDAEAYAMARCGRTQDVKEAAIAFKEKRPADFKGR
jgi:2-(1,2-epoxy-1,2-dihydrophenyl)acetyl-CoA isomerase